MWVTRMIVVLIFNFYMRVIVNCHQTLSVIRKNKGKAHDYR